MKEKTATRATKAHKLATNPLHITRDPDRRKQEKELVVLKACSIGSIIILCIVSVLLLLEKKIVLALMTIISLGIYIESDNRIKQIKSHSLMK